MSKISNIHLLDTFMKFLFLLVSAKLFSLVILWFLPSNGVDMQKTASYKHSYQRVDFKNMFMNKKKLAQKVAKEEVATSDNGVTGITITNLVLKGLYGKGTEGFAILALKSNQNKTEIVSVGESYQGYTLESIHTQHVMFKKNSKLYRLQIDATEATNSATKSFITPTTTEKLSTVSRKDINFYAKNPKKIMEDIVIFPLKSNGKIKGFKVSKIKKNSKMAQLGLKKGDLIIKANNIVLTSYKNALDLYKNLDKIDTVQIVVMRNNEEKELIYDIN